MAAAKDCQDSGEHTKQMTLPRFFWRLTRAWHQIKKSKPDLEKFWKNQATLLKDFDHEFPQHYQPAALPGQRPTLTPASPLVPPPASRPLPPPAPLVPPQASRPPPPLAPSKPALPVSPAASKPPPLAASRPTPPVATLVASRPLPRPVPQACPTSSKPPAPQYRPLPLPRPIPKASSKLPPPQASQHPAASKSQPFPPPRSPSPKYINSFAQLDQDEDSDYEPPAPVNKGKQKEGGAGPKKPRIRVIDEILPDTPPAEESEKRRAVPEKTDVRRVPACERCHNTKKPCFEQKGSSIVCYNCTKLKMKCIPQSDEGHQPPAPSATSIPAKRPTLDPVAPTKPPKRSALDPKKRKVVKTPERVESSSNEDESDLEEGIRQAKGSKKPAPAPAPKKKKSQQKGRSYADFEAYYGMFIISSSHIFF